MEEKKISFSLFDTSKSEKVVETDIKRCISYSAPGPHTIVVIKLKIFTNENAKTIEWIMISFTMMRKTATSIVQHIK